MDDDGESELVGQIPLPDKRSLLSLKRILVVMKVDPDLTDRFNPVTALDKVSERLDPAVVDLSDTFGMDPDRGVDASRPV